MSRCVATFVLSMKDLSHVSLLMVLLVVVHTQLSGFFRY